MTLKTSQSPLSHGPIPNHIAIVMDGNGRWAQERGLPRFHGHIRGAAILEDVVAAINNLGVKRLTLYCFSTENWKRPQEELDALMTLLRDYMISQREPFEKNNIRLRVIGRRDRMPIDVLKEMDETIRLTSSNTGLTLSLAINYGARQEIIDATRQILLELLDPAKRVEALAKAGVSTLEELINERYFSDHLYDPEASDPDLFIRTGGEQRLSNYLLWELSYAELWFTEVLWPDFTPEKLKEAITAFQKRNRRFGGVDSNGLIPPSFSTNESPTYL